LPLDIRIETLVSVFLICFGLVAGANPLRPISWNIWAANIENQGGRDNPFGSLEERRGFLDIRVGALKDNSFFSTSIILTTTSRRSERNLPNG
jgi:hypothetical protein